MFGGVSKAKAGGWNTKLGRKVVLEYKNQPNFGMAVELAKVSRIFSASSVTVSLSDL